MAWGSGEDVAHTRPAVNMSCRAWPRSKQKGQADFELRVSAGARLYNHPRRDEHASQSPVKKPDDHDIKAIDLGAKWRLGLWKAWC